MHLPTTLLSLLLAATATQAGSSWLTGSSQVALSDDLKVPGNNPLYYCSAADDDILKIETVDLDPNPPQAGKELVITAAGNLTQNITDGAKIHLQVKYGLITLINQEADLCDQVKNVDLECPLKEGETQLSKEVALPREIPPGKYTVLADVFTKTGEKITCLTATVFFHR